VPRHDLDGIALMAGVVFAGLGLVSLVSSDGPTARWTWPVLLIVAGVVGLLASRSDRNSER
jgi:hypothetical protein